jgi:spore germination cell wall hydrolase CwlJ-like protein
MPIPTQNVGGAKFTPVGASSMDNDDLDAVTRTILGEVGPNASPAEMASIASVVRNRMAAGGYGQTPYDVVHRPN